MVAHALSYADTLSWARARVAHALFRCDTPRECARRSAEGRRVYGVRCVFCFRNLHNRRAKGYCWTCDAPACNYQCRKLHVWLNECGDYGGCKRCWRAVGSYSPLLAASRGRGVSSLPATTLRAVKMVRCVLAAGGLCDLCRAWHSLWLDGIRDVLSNRGVDYWNCTGDSEDSESDDDSTGERMIARIRARVEKVRVAEKFNTAVVRVCSARASRRSDAHQRQHVASELRALLANMPSDIVDPAMFTCALQAVCETGNVAAQRLLLTYVKPTTRCFEAACRQSDTGTLQCLLHSARDHSVGDYDATREMVLMVAVRDDRALAVNWLLHRDTTPIKNGALLTAARVARDNGHASMARWLEAKLQRAAHDDAPVYERAQLLPGAHIVSRHAQVSCHALDRFERTAPLSELGLRLSQHAFRRCYPCGQRYRNSHPVYLYSCVACGTRFQSARHRTRDLLGRTALVTGGRTKLGHQIVLKLLRARCRVVLTTRNPRAAVALFSDYADAAQFRLHVYAEPLDLDSAALEPACAALAHFIAKQWGALDILINCAAQTIRARDKSPVAPTAPCSATNRYGDAQCVHSTHPNSWLSTVLDTTQAEIEEVMRVNATAPFVLVRALHGVLRKSSVTPFIINVHAREGLATVRKSSAHTHTNMAKAAMHMFTKCLVSHAWHTDHGARFAVHGCDPGWISVDEYYDDDTKPFDAPPLDEIDGAARVLYPLWRNLASCRVTRRHFTHLVH